MPYTNKSRTTPKMQRAHFEFIAAVFKAGKPDRGNMYAPRSVRVQGEAAHAAWSDLVSDFAFRLADTNPNFRRADFLAACGIEE